MHGQPNIKYLMLFGMILILLCRTLNSMPCLYYIGTNIYVYILYRVIYISFRDLWPLRYSSRDGHAEGEHVNRGRDTPRSVLPYRCSICPPFVIYRAPDKLFSHTHDSLGRWPRSAQAATLLEFHVLLTNWYGGTRWRSDWGTALQTERSRDRFPIMWLEFFIDIILPTTLWPWGRLINEYHEYFLGVKAAGA
jgi:hypothetical protein